MRRSAGETTPPFTEIAEKSPVFGAKRSAGVGPFSIVLSVIHICRLPVRLTPRRTAMPSVEVVEARRNS